MATTRPTVSVYSHEKPGEIIHSIKMPSVFVAPLRPDSVRYIHTNMAKNRRQPYGVAQNAGYQTSAQSWGTGRAVSRIPRVPGGGTHRAGQAAFGNMCRGGGMFSPNKTWRRWHRKINITEKRHAVVSALAATAIPPLVMARGHRIDEVPELPLVVDDKIQSLEKTKAAVELMKRIGCEEDLQRVIDSIKVRTGKGKMRNRRYVQRRGPLVIYAEDTGLTRAFRNIPGVDLCHVDRMNLLQLAPGGTLGRLVIWSSSAFKKLHKLYGPLDTCATSEMKKGYHMPRALMTNADLGRIINSDEIQSVARPCIKQPKREGKTSNPLRNINTMFKVNPCAARIKGIRRMEQMPGTLPHTNLQAKKKKREMERKKSAKKGKAFYRELTAAFSDKKQCEIEKKEEARLAAAGKRVGQA